LGNLLKQKKKIKMSQKYNNLFIVLKNSVLQKKKFVLFFYSKLNLIVVELLKKRGFIRYFTILKLKNNKKYLKIYLKYISKSVEPINSYKKAELANNLLLLKNLKKNELKSLILSYSKTNKSFSGKIIASIY